MAVLVALVLILYRLDCVVSLIDVDVELDVSIHPSVFAKLQCE